VPNHLFGAEFIPPVPFAGQRRPCWCASQRCSYAAWLACKACQRRSRFQQISANFRAVALLIMSRWARHNSLFFMPMSRTARAIEAGMVYHVLNRGNGRMSIFHKAGDYEAFERMLAELRAICRRRRVANVLPDAQPLAPRRSPQNRQSARPLDGFSEG
jgi:hypothetical protein